MKESSFQFSNPSLLSIEYRLNKDFAAAENKATSISNSCNVKVMRNEQENKAFVILDITIDKAETEITNISPFFIKLNIGADFEWDNSIDGVQIPSLLAINAPSLLLSYARSIVAFVTCNSPYNAYHIPFINFTAESK